MDAVVSPVDGSINTNVVGEDLEKATIRISGLLTKKDGGSPMSPTEMSGIPLLGSMIVKRERYPSYLAMRPSGSTRSSAGGTKSGAAMESPVFGSTLKYPPDFEGTNKSPSGVTC